MTLTQRERIHGLAFFGVYLWKACRSFCNEDAQKELKRKKLLYITGREGHSNQYYYQIAHCKNVCVVSTHLHVTRTQKYAFIHMCDLLLCDSNILFMCCFKLAQWLKS